ncbi:hypothetical protein SUDANB105_07904 [Streptomyces sp. enrichment culture]|uniref:helicase-related protein n=1 Tax=Streptomyces sp. enrichment culture TaxID=1795815 RepID=UPI003F547ABF
MSGTRLGSVRASSLPSPSDCAILANSRLIAEGVDIPSVDAVVLADLTRSVTRCVQALGRALRVDVSGKTASLIGPVQFHRRRSLQRTQVRNVNTMPSST